MRFKTYELKVVDIHTTEHEVQLAQNGVIACSRNVS